MSDSEVHIKQGYITEFFHAGKMAHSSTHSEHLWSGWEHSEVVGGAFQQWWQWCERQSQILDSSAQLSHHKMKSISISSSAQIGGLRSRNLVRSWILASVHWKQWQQCWNIAKFMPGGSGECPRSNRKNTVSKLVKTYWISTRLMATVSWFTPLPVTRCGITGVSQSQKCSPRNGDVNSSLKKKFKTHSSEGKVIWTVFWDSEAVILLDFLEPRQTIKL